MKPVVFLGPSLSIEAARGILDAEYLPPVAQGDVYRALDRNPPAIGIIDGYFDRVASVWHKEILWALTQGIHVMGAASMGALRAVELAPFGMIGVGEVFRAFHLGEIDDDDEVAVSHAAAEHGFRPLSDAMVNIRATIRAAIKACIVSQSTAERLLSLAKSLPYAERSFRRLGVVALESGIEAEEARAWSEFTRTNVVDQKGLDAAMLLRFMASFLAASPPPVRPRFRFEHTDAWENARLRLVEPSQRDVAVPSSDLSSLLEEVRVLGHWPRVRAGALARALALKGPGAPEPPAPDAIRSAAEEFRREHDLIQAHEFATWRTDHGLEDEVALTAFFTDEATVRAVTLAWAPTLERRVADHLRAIGEWRRFAGRAQQKAAALRARTQESPTLSDVGESEGDVWRWYFEQVLERRPPANREVYARGAGFEDAHALLRAVLRERCFREIGGNRHFADEMVCNPT
jgi:hypothetical protein